MPQGDMRRFTATYTMPQGTVAQWVWHAIQTSTGDALNSLLIVAAQAVLEAAWDELSGQISPNVAGDTLQMAEWDEVLEEWNTIREVDISDQEGTSGSTEMLPHQDAGVVKFFTNVGRSLGKKFIFGMVEAAQTDSVVAAATVTILALFALAFDDDFTDGTTDWSPGNWNKVSGVFREWNKTVSALTTIGSCDRRRPGIGI